MENLDKLQYDGHVTIYPFPEENNDRYTGRWLFVSLPCVEPPANPYIRFSDVESGSPCAKVKILTR